ncbi:hypothetical protein J4Q44_G00316870 [Coregonus suidteri]|uniref:Uncharacterized protein n=1 Tax=Coregonus suidteri TaxID=861788 RepID=A0AAN8KW70_9TELE
MQHIGCQPPLNSTEEEEAYSESVCITFECFTWKWLFCECLVSRLKQLNCCWAEVTLGQTPVFLSVNRNSQYLQFYSHDAVWEERWAALPW